MVCIESTADVAFVASRETCKTVREILSAPLIPLGMLHDRCVAEVVNSVKTIRNVRVSGKTTKLMDIDEHNDKELVW